MSRAIRALSATLTALAMLTTPAAALAADDPGALSMPVVSARPEREEMDDLAARNADAVEDGSHALVSALDGEPSLAVDQGGTPSLAQNPLPESASWSFSHDEGGYLTIALTADDRVLGVSPTASEGSRVTLAPASGSRSQRWIAVPEGGGIVFVCALDRSLVLDVADGELVLGAHDGSAGQLWSTIDPAQLGGDQTNAPADPAPSAVPAGTYYIASSLNEARVIGASGTSVQLGAATASSAQRWEIAYDDEGQATVTNALSGMALGVESLHPAPGSGVVLSAPDGHLTQKWLIESVDGAGGRGVFRLRPALFRPLALEVPDGAAAGAVRVDEPDGSAAQSFYIVAPSRLAVPLSGTYQIRSAANESQVIDVAGGSSDNGANIQTYADNGGAAQIWDVWQRPDGTFLIKNAASGKALDVAGGVAAAGANVQLWQKVGSAAQAWTIVFDRGAGGYRIASALDPSLVLTVSGEAASGASVVVASDEGAPGQRFLLDEASYTPAILDTVSWIGARSYTEGRDGNDWTALVIHISECTTLSAVDNTFLGTSQTSAHFGVSDSEIHQYVSLDDTAWAVGNWTWNTKTVSIEHVGTTAWPPSRATLDRSAQLMAALARTRQWPELVLGENVGVHKWYSATSCPATLDVTYLVSKANEYMGNGFTFKSVAGGAAQPSLAAMSVAPVGELA